MSATRNDGRSRGPGQQLAGSPNDPRQPIRTVLISDVTISCLSRAGHRPLPTVLDVRRTLRPSDEYREPTDREWEEFRDHFNLRKVALGQCDRPYATPCQHESACIRCPMLRLDIAQVPRLLQIESNQHERLEEAQGMRWLGEVAAIEEGLRHIEKKKQQAQRLAEQAARTP
jgi:hypothetical protein